MVRHNTPLGSDQLKLLSMLEANGGVWYRGCGWCLRQPSQTIQILETLVKRDLVEVGYCIVPTEKNQYAGYTTYHLPKKEQQ